MYGGDNYRGYLLDESGSIVGLNLTAMKLVSFPDAILAFEQLTHLNLYYNYLRELPSRIRQLRNLTWFDCSKNRITRLPVEICDLDQPLLMVGAQIMSQLGLNFGHNPLESPPLETVKQGLEAVRAYFKELGEGEATRLFEAKLLLVGQGGVGKTYLKERLIHDRVVPTKSTEGIDIDCWTLATKQTSGFRANLWDFGGQEIYHATHQFFLTKRSLYLFAWEARSDADLLSFDYWLNTVKVLSDNSPVLVIQTKIDERTKSINQEGWKRRFPNIVGYFDVSAVEDLGITELREAIARALEELPHIGDVLPKRWMDIRGELEGLSENFIGYERYAAICSEHGMDAEQTARLAEYFHDLGVFLHFKRNPILQNTVFLNPEWATNAVYMVADCDSVKDEHGHFAFSQLPDIWVNKEEYPVDKHIELVELMKSFELCFELPSGEEYMVPELLRAEQPPFDWDNEGALRYRYSYGFMPSGILTRFIVITHDLIKDDLYWKDGVVLVREGTEALIVKTGSRLIEVWVRGEDRKTLLGIIRRHFDYIHTPLSGNLELDEMVPCVCARCRSDADPHFYPYAMLVEASRKGVEALQCQRSFEFTAPDSLLGGVQHASYEERRSLPRRIKIFLASSNELNAERKEIELLIGKENRQLFYQNVFLDLVLWEDLCQSFHGDRIQDHFNEELAECEIVICLFFTKVGRFTKEEFDLAYEGFKADENPRHLYVFFKSGKVDIDDIDEGILEIGKLKKEIAEAEQIYKSFDSEPDLILQLKRQLDLIVPRLI